MTDKYASSSVLITGASRGIGRVIATTFAKKTNHPLILLARSADDLKQTKEHCLEAGARQAVHICCDLTDPSSVENLAYPENFPTPGILINNAGQYLLKPLQKTSYDEYLNQIKANLFSAVHVVNRFLPTLHTLDRGLILNICSSGALEGLGDSGAYASSKHALLGYTRSLRQELLDSEIGVTALNLGQTQSTSWEGSDVDPEKLINPQDVADLLVALSKLSARSVAEEITLKPQHGRVPPM
jgi:short-subunit dehydrogenase